MEDTEFIRKSIEINHDGLAQLEEGFKKLGLNFIPSVGNFLTVKIGEKLSEVDSSLQQKGIIVRPVENYGLSGFLRVSVGLERENARFLKTLETAL